MSSYIELEDELIKLVSEKQELERLESRLLVAKKHISDHAQNIIVQYDETIGWTNAVQVGGDTYIIKFDLESGTLEDIQHVLNFSIMARQEYGQ